MLESMITSMSPTRAEVSDVANAVLDGSDAVMLSAETAKGLHPIIVINTMDRICRAAEKHPSTLTSTYRVERSLNRVDEVTSMATMYAANLINVRAIICLTETGITPLWMSRIRSGIPIYGLSRHPLALGKMALYSDVYPINFDVTKYDTSQVKLAAIAELKNRGYVDKNDLVIISYGDHVGVHGSTNSMTILAVDGI
jgi:pyruvate kinase